MTQIRPLAQPVRRRPGELGVHSLDRFNFTVPDIAADNCTDTIDVAPAPNAR